MNENFNYDKNDYILDLKEEIMTREFIYNDDTYNKLRLNDISTKKNNTTTQRISKVGNLFLSEITGYPTFYTQLVFNETKKSISIKTVLNNTEAISLISKCKKTLRYKKQT
tara:strand:- start:407 stop:739 length:333 start_codon:yes stop_codon:yes gene_type:complete